ncbi:MAG TPA: hypothetical protein ENI69_11025 [Rhodospirillales bacterium]|nr:hypothetical protein [Rhodospirillales bacterium]
MAHIGTPAGENLVQRRIAARIQLVGIICFTSSSRAAMKLPSLTADLSGSGSASRVAAYPVSFKNGLSANSAGINVRVFGNTGLS